jgi:hypothetical protein
VQFDNVSDDIFNCRYTEDMELEDAIHTAILTLKEGYLFLFVLLLQSDFIVNHINGKLIMLSTIIYFLYVQI